MIREANAVDFWRGFALVTIFVNHIPGIYYEHFTHRNFSFSDSAELFVFLAGWALRLIVGRPEDPLPTSQLVARLGGRAVTIYAAHILIVSIAIAMLAIAARLLDNPLFLEWHNAAPVFYDPVDAHIGLMLLTHHLGYFDILPLYVVLMLAGPVVAIIHRLAPALLLPLSLALYLCALIFHLTIPSWPTSGGWFFNPIAWQFIFVLGFVMARDRGLSAYVQRHINIIRAVSLPVVAISAVVVFNGWMPDPTTMPEPRLLFVDQKTYLTPIRVVQFLALVAVFSAAYRYIAAVARPGVEYLSMLGRNSLQVFCVGSLLSLVAQILRFVIDGGIAMDTAILVGGVGLLGFTAWVSEWRVRVRRPQ